MLNISIGDKNFYKIIIALSLGKYIKQDNYLFERDDYPVFLHMNNFFIYYYHRYTIRVEGFYKIINN